MEDILEELVGEIWDEHDEEINYFKKISDDSEIVNAEADLSDFFEHYELDADEYEYDANTVSGWVIEQLGAIPSIGKSFIFKNISVEITKASVKKVLEIKVTRIPQEQDEKAETSDRKDKLDVKKSKTDSESSHKDLEV